MKSDVCDSFGACGSRYDRFVEHSHVPNFDDTVVTATRKPTRLHRTHSKLRNLRRSEKQQAAARDRVTKVLPELMVGTVPLLLTRMSYNLIV
jgi:hypothetical protein